MKLAISNIISSTVRSEHELGGAKLTLKVSPRARRMRLHVDPRTRSVILTMPKRMSQRRALAWAGEEGKLSDAAAELQASLELSDADIESLIAQRSEAKKTRNFARADAIRNDLAAKGILLEDSKDGVRWKRK